MITQHPAWNRLVGLSDSLASLQLRQAFASDPGRGERFARELPLGDEALFVDFSKQLVTQELMNAFADVIDAAKVTEFRDAAFSGGRINNTENQPALHTALRAPREEKVLVDGLDVVAEVHRVRDELAKFSARVASGEIRGATGQKFTHVLNVGIGGSDLGPALVYEVLTTLRSPRLECRFVSNLDATDLVSQLATLNAQSTLVVISSKTFATIETLANAKLIQQWLGTAMGDSAVAQHCVVVSAQPERAARVGIVASHSFLTWAWVGGRYSVSSAVAAVVVIAFGGEVFDEFLHGMYQVDQHFLAAPVLQNLPMLLAMIDIWNSSVLGMSTHAVLPYSTALSLLPAYLQQLEMESNGKRVSRDGEAVVVGTSPVVWGGVGTNAQHAFMQMLHQGTQLVPADFICFARPSHRHTAQHDALVANALAQAQALAFGRTADELTSAGVHNDLVAHRVAPGNRPSTVIIATQLTPATLGALIALYEHKVFVAGCVWGINSFDQWGVELGKTLAADILDDLNVGSPREAHDSSTSQLMNWFAGHRKHL